MKSVRVSVSHWICQQHHLLFDLLAPARMKVGAGDDEHMSIVNHRAHPTRATPPSTSLAIPAVRVLRYQTMYQRTKARRPPRRGHYVALVAIALDFVTNVLHDMWHDQRPFFLDVADYHRYRLQHPRAHG